MIPNPQNTQGVIPQYLPPRPKKSRKKFFVIGGVILVVIIIFSVIASIPFQNNTGNLVYVAPTPYSFDEQIAVSFQNYEYSALSFNVTVTQQVDQNGLGPAYLLNGMTSSGYWYQVGISYHWSVTLNNKTYYHNEYMGAMEIFAPNGTSIFLRGHPYMFPLDIHAKDIVNLYMYIQNGTVYMGIYDFNTHAGKNITYSSFGSQYFVCSNGPVSSQGFFTGIMTEFRHIHPYYANESKVVYTAVGGTIPYVCIAIDEWNTTPSQPLFSQTSSVIDLSQYPQGYTYYYQNVSVYATENTFITD